MKSVPNIAFTIQTMRGFGPLCAEQRSLDLNPPEIKQECRCSSVLNTFLLKCNFWVIFLIFLIVSMQ